MLVKTIIFIANHNVKRRGFLGGLVFAFIQNISFIQNNFNFVTKDTEIKSQLNYNKIKGRIFF